MGNKKIGKTVKFIQSVGDFPLTVSLGEKVPAWGLSRWAGQGLRFVPPDDEGFSLRGDRQRLLYKGRRRSHRFTILGDTAFEYDCILEKEPERNVISLLMEGADNFDFFRQPDFLKDPLLAGSYAVYKKETFIGEGTGKLCHIHRPEVIDSRGRRCWGDLSIIGNELRITIPEAWLSQATYPVIVDPTIGTTTVGSQTQWEQEPGDWVPLSNEMSIPVNRFLAADAIQGLCTACFYVYSSEEPESAGYPVLYAETGTKPAARRSGNEQYIDFKVGGGKAAGWRSGTFEGSAAAGDYVWFGAFTLYFWFARFDYGGNYYHSWWTNEAIPDIYPETYGSPESMKLSMYFSYSAAQNYTRKLTQGVTLTDGRKLTGVYKRAMTMNANGVTLLGHSSRYYREQSGGVAVTDGISRFRVFFRFLREHLTAKELIGHWQDFLRCITGRVGSAAVGKRSVGAWRGLGSLVGTEDVTVRGRGFIRFLVTSAAAMGIAGGSAGRMRVIRQEAAGFDSMGHLGEYIRGVYVEAGNIAETRHRAEYHRKQQDTAGSTGVSLRHVFIFLRLLTGAYIRDFIIGRFLKSREEVIIKSPVCRELILDSRLH